MKASRYNVIIEQDSHILAFNCLTGAFAKMDRRQYTEYLQIVDTEPGTETKLDSETDAFIAELKRGGFIVDDDFDELDLVKVKHLGTRFGSRVLSLTVAPTLDCNFACPYCYEIEKRAEYMTKEVEARLVNYIDQRLTGMSGLHVTWFGGEPLVAIDTLYCLSEQLRQKAAEKGIEYSQQIITNGYNLTKEVALRIKSIAEDVKAQVTLDGPPEIHNVRRPLSDGRESFHVIVNNLQEVAGQIMPVVVRVNMDEANFSAFPKLLDILKQRGLEKRLTVFVANTEVEPGACQSMSDSRASVPRFSKIEAEARAMLLDRGFKMRSLFLFPNFASCVAVSANSLVITPKGDTYKCWHVIDDLRERAANIFEPATFNKNETKWLAWNPLERDECLNCRVLPLCMGGCPYKSVDVERRPKVADRDRCYTVKYNIREMLKTEYCQYEMHKRGLSQEEKR